MGTAVYGIAKFGHSGRDVRGRLVTSGDHTTTTTASNLTDGAAGAGSEITANIGDVLTIRLDEDGRVMFGGETATATYGHPLFANQVADIEVTGSGTISIVDRA